MCTQRKNGLPDGLWFSQSMARSTTTEAFRSGSSRNSLLVAGPRHLVVVDGEAIVEAEQLLQHGGADERGRVPALLLENARQRVRGGLQDEAAGVAHFVNVGFCR